MGQQNSKAAQALQGIKILDFSQFIAGPFATMMLGDMGAEVIKIEKPGEGDSFRSWTFFNRRFQDGSSSAYMAWNRNKQSFAIDLKNEAAKAVLYEMVKESDVVVENFRPGVMDRLGFGYEKLKEINPEIIYASNTGYGATGPYASWPGQDLLIQGLTGLTGLTGRKTEPPTPLGTGLPDMLASFHLVYGILSALIYKMNTGRGQRVEVDLMRSTMALESQEFMMLLNQQVAFERPDSGIGRPFQQPPAGIYKCLDGYIVLGQADSSALAQVLEDSSIELSLMQSAEYEKRDEIFNAIEQIVQTKTTMYWVGKMSAAGICTAPVADITEVENNPQVQYMKAVGSFETGGEPVRCIAPAVTMSETPASIQKAPPRVGQDTVAVLKKAGLSQTSINRLIKEGIVGI